MQGTLTHSHSGVGAVALRCWQWLLRARRLIALAVAVVECVLLCFSQFLYFISFLLIAGSVFLVEFASRRVLKWSDGGGRSFRRFLFKFRDYKWERKEWRGQGRLQERFVRGD